MSIDEIKRKIVDLDLTSIQKIELNYLLEMLDKAYQELILEAHDEGLQEGKRYDY